MRDTSHIKPVPASLKEIPNQASNEDEDDEEDDYSDYEIALSPTKIK